MNLSRSTDDKLSSKTPEDGESLRKKMKTEKSVRKGWSLTDRKTDQEVLIEMGVGLLEQDEFEKRSEAIVMSSPRKSNLKRKRDIENVNPNVINSPSKFSPKIVMPSPGPSRILSPKSLEKLKPLQPSDQQSLETSIIEGYQIDEETPMGQGITGEVFGLSAGSSGGRTSRNSYASPGPAQLPAEARGGGDSFAALSDEMLLSVFRWLPKRTLAHCMLVCKRWQRVSCDETLWQRLDLGNKTIARGALGRILNRKPVIVRLASSEIGEWRPKSLITTRIQYLDLSMSNIDQITLDALILRCPGLKKLSLENVQVYDTTFSLIGKCSNIETLNLTMSRGVTDNGLKLLFEGCSNLQSLNISWCSLTEEALDVLVCQLPQRLQRLNLSGAKIMNDDMVSRLVARCPRLLELDLSDCSALHEPALSSLLCLARLEHLALSRCYYLPPHAFTRLSSMPALQFLEVWGMLQTASLTLLKAALPAIHVNQYMFSAISRPTVGNRRTSVWGLRTRD